MFVAMIFVFVAGYTLIALEHPIKINKSATALILGSLLWVMLVLGGEKILVSTDSLKHYFENVINGSFLHWVTHHELLEHLGEISQIIFFLMGAMTIVEVVDSYEGFRIITDKIKTTRRVKLLWVLSVLTFFMSAALDNLTTSIVMVALLRKLIGDKKDRWFFAGMIVVAANAGGAWSPIGDVTTIMLWIAGKVSTLSIIKMTFVPSLVSMIVPLAILSFTLKGNVKRPESRKGSENGLVVSALQSNILFFIGVGGLLFVPVFKSYTHLPPYLGMLFSLGVIWVVTEVMHRQVQAEKRADSRQLTVVGILRKIDVPSILFFLGILTAVAALDTTGHLDLLAEVLHENVGNLYIINIIIGVLSAIVDNVPLVAGAMGMYNFPTDHYFWEFLAYCAGTGGSILIIGSAAGVAVMGMENIDFIWYLKKISWLALVGYLAGAATYIAQEESGLLHASHELADERMVNVNSREDVIRYLTSVEFIADEFEDQSGISESMYFIYYPDAKYDEIYMGYYVTINKDGNESWEGQLNKEPAEMIKISDSQIRIRILDKTFIVNSDGVVYEELPEKGAEIKPVKAWHPLIEEE
jgi:Na+/H+ antiporter NhaD/arsenite permease-like protein